MSLRGRIVVTSVALFVLAGLAVLLVRAQRIDWPEHPSITVRVVRTDGTPAIGASVDVGALQPRPRRQWMRIQRFHDRALVDPEPVARFTTDGTGTARLPWRYADFGDVAVAAHVDGAWGERIVAAAAPHDSVHEICIAPDTAFAVRVLDAEGGAVQGAEVRAIGTSQRPDGGFAADSVLAWARTDASGTATFVHAQGWSRSVARVADRRTFTVRPWLPGLDVTTTVDADAVPHEPIELRLPPTGRIEVVTVDAAGAPMHENVIVCLSPTTHDDAMSLESARADGLVFPHVALGTSYAAFLPGLCGRHEFAGPQAAGETVRITLQTTRQSHLAGRLLLDAVPLAGAHVTITGNGERLGEGDTDEFGKFAFRHLSLWAAMHDEIDLVVRAADGTEFHGRVRSRVRATDHRVDLGDVAVHRPTPPPLMLSGRIFAPRGVENLRLDVQARLGDREETTAIEADVTLAPDGTFVVHGEDPRRPLSLAVSGERHERREPIRFRYGATGREIAMQPLVELHVPFVIGSRELGQCLRFELRRDGERTTERPDGRVWSDDGILTCSWFVADTGAHTVTVTCPGRDAPLVSAPCDVVADERHECRVERIAVPAVRVLHVAIPGAPTSDAWLESYVQVAAGNDWHDAERDGSTWLVASDTPVDLRVVVPEHRAVTLRGVDADTSVELQPGVLVELDLDLPAMPADTTLEINLIERDDATNRSHGKAFRGNRAIVRLPGSGTYFLMANVWPVATTFECNPPEIVVGDDGGTFRVALRESPP